MPVSAGRAETASGADVAGTGLPWEPPQPIPEAESGPQAHGQRRRGGCSSSACQDQHLETFSAAGAPSPSTGAVIRKLGPVSDTSFYAISPAKSQKLGGWGWGTVKAQGERRLGLGLIDLGEFTKFGVEVESEVRGFPSPGL